MTSAVGEKNFVSMESVLENLCGFFAGKDLLSDEGASAHLVRCAYNALNIYKKLPSEQQKKLKDKYAGVKKLCRSYGYFGDKSLEMRCKGTAFWAAYKAVDKIF